MQKTFSNKDFAAVQKLLEDGEDEPRLEEYLGGLEDFSEGVLIPPLQDRRCALCTIPDYPYSQSEIILESNNHFYIVETEDLKGHERRNMLVLDEHDVIPSDQEFQQYAAEGLKSLVDHTYNEGPVVVYAGNTTFHHPHIVASDIRPDDLEASKLGEVSNYILFRDTNNLTDPEYEEYGNLVGEAFLKRFYKEAVEGL